MSDAGRSSSPWNELAQQASRLPLTNRERASERDRAVRAAVVHGTPVSELAEQLGVTVQAVYQAVDRAEEEARAHRSSGYADTAAALEAMTDPVAFERLVSTLLADFIPDLRPTQAQGDRGRDAVAGVRRLHLDEGLVVTMSLQKDWSRKIREDLARLSKQAWDPQSVYAVTNRLASVRRVDVLQQTAAEYGWALTVFDGRWLATQLSRPEHLDLRSEYLRLPRPRPTLFLTTDEFDAVSHRAQPVRPTQLVGRETQLIELTDRLRDGHVVILQGAGGLGKSRLLAELAGRREEWIWFFVRDGLAFSAEMLSETGAGTEIVVVVDDAHRRADLRALLGGLERRSPSPRVVLITRPGFVDQLQGALEGLALGDVDVIDLPPLSRPHVVELLETPPLVIRYGSLRTAIVDIAAGNPQIATIAGELAAKGLALHELSRDEVMRNYVAGVLRHAVGDSRERLALVALIAALGKLELSTKWMHEASQLLGMTSGQIRREVAELADRGMVIEDNGTAAIKPDLLAERILVGCFFDSSWRPALDYEDVYSAFSLFARVPMLSMLGQALQAERNTTFEGPSLVREDILRHCSIASTTDEMLHAAELAGHVAPGLPSISAAAFDLLIARLPAGTPARNRIIPALAHLLRLLPGFEEGWQRLLKLSQLVFASQPDALTKKAITDALDQVHRRLPVDQSDRDGQVLASVQHSMTQITSAHWHRERGQPGAAETIARAARTMLTVIFEVHQLDASDSDQVHLIAVAVPPSEFTQHCLNTGARLLLETLSELQPDTQREQIERLCAFAHPALDLPGPFGIRPSEGTKDIINTLFDDVIEPWFVENIGNLRLPVAAEAIELFEWRTHFKRPPGKVMESPELREYRSLIHPGDRWLHDEDFDQQRDRDRKHAEQYAARLRPPENMRPVLDQWGRWITEYVEAKGAQPWHPALAMTLEATARDDRASGVALVDYLIETNSPLIGHASGAMIEALQGDNAVATAMHWAESTNVSVQRVLAWAAAGLPDDPQRPILEKLANSPDIDVRIAVTRALRYRSGVVDWRARLALQLVARDNDFRVLVDVLKALGDSETDGVGLDDDELELAQTALLHVAGAPNGREGHDVAEALTALRSLGRDILWEWIWLRIGSLTKQTSTTHIVSPNIPDQVLALVSERVPNEPIDDHLHRALDWLDDEDLYFRAQDALVLLVDKLDDHSPLLLEYLRRWASGTQAKKYVVSEILKTRAPWDVFTTRVRAVLAGDGSPRMIDSVLYAREPTTFMGSRVPSYEETKKSFMTWGEDPDGNLVRASILAEQYYDKLIADARAEEQARQNGY